MSILCQDVKKTYNKRKSRRLFETTKVLNGVNLEISEGEIYGLLGLNGAGKTTLIRILSGILCPDSGNVSICGMSYREDERKIKKSIGVVLGGDRAFYWKLSAAENLEFFGTLYGLKKRELKEKIEEKLSLVGLHEKKDSLVETYSRGMRQRLHIAKALIIEPAILLLDEPTIWLDVKVAHDFRELILSLNANRNLTILLTTHYLDEAVYLCSKIGILNNGVIANEGTIHDLMARFPYDKCVYIKIDNLHDLEFAQARASSLGFITESSKEGFNVKFYLKKEKSLIDLLEVLNSVDLKFSNMEQRGITLEDVILYA